MRSPAYRLSSELSCDGWGDRSSGHAAYTLLSHWEWLNWRRADAALGQLSTLFDEMYRAIGRPSIPPERLLKASLLMALCTVRSERMFCEQLDYYLLFRWLLDMDVAEPSFDHSTFSRNRTR